jgi:hypothetical protein
MFSEYQWQCIPLWARSYYIPELQVGLGSTVRILVVSVMWHSLEFLDLNTLELHFRWQKVISQDWISLYLWNSCLNILSSISYFDHGWHVTNYLVTDLTCCPVNSTQLCVGAFGLPISHACGGSRVGNSVFNMQQISEFIFVDSGHKLQVCTRHTSQCWPAVHICNWAHLRTQNLQPVA